MQQYLKVKKKPNVFFIVARRSNAQNRRKKGVASSALFIVRGQDDRENMTSFLFHENSLVQGSMVLK